MKNLGNPIFSFVLLSVLFVILSSISTTSQEVEDQREFDYVEGSGKGPENWGDLHKEWAACKNGDMQSPIDLANQRVEVVPKLGKLKMNYKPCKATVKNRGHDITISMLGDAGSIQVSGTDYVLKQCHWHSPSEHTINGRRYDLELHMVHQGSDPSAQNKTAVVGLLYKIGSPDPYLSKLMRKISSIADTKEERDVGVIDPREIKMGGSKYYRYMGSLTVPPCTEGVIWTMNRRVRTVSREQVKLLRDAVHDYAEKNTRPLQPLNARELYFYGPNLQTSDLHE